MYAVPGAFMPSTPEYRQDRRPVRVHTTCLLRTAPVVAPTARWLERLARQRHASLGQTPFTGRNYVDQK
jgi:hypothetical protein